MTEALDQYGVAILFAIVALQAMGIGGLPGKTALVAASILAADGHFALWHVLGATAVGVTVGGYAGYGIARTGGRRLLVGEHRLARRLEGPLGMAERFFEAHGAKAVFLARFLPGLKVVAAPAAGVARMPWRSFALWHALGAVAFALVFGLTGYYAGKGAIALVEQLGVYAAAPLLALGVLGWVGYRAVRRRRAERFGSASAGNEPAVDIRDDSDANVLGPIAEETRGDEATAERRNVVHRLVAPSGEAADSLVAILRNHGYEATAENGREASSPCRVEARKLRTDGEDAADDRALVAELAAEHGAEYEGT